MKPQANEAISGLAQEPTLALASHEQSTSISYELG